MIQPSRMQWCKVDLKGQFFLYLLLKASSSWAESTSHGSIRSTTAICLCFHETRMKSGYHLLRSTFPKSASVLLESCRACCTASIGTCCIFKPVAARGVSSNTSQSLVRAAFKILPIQLSLDYGREIIFIIVCPHSYTTYQYPSGTCNAMSFLRNGCVC